jgi:hypothetical protein
MNKCCYCGHEIKGEAYLPYEKHIHMVFCNEQCYEEWVREDHELEMEFESRAS